MWDELQERAQALAAEICSTLPGGTVPVVVSVDEPEIDEESSSLWHVKVRFHMRCA